MDKRTSRSSDKDILEYYHSPLAGQGPFYQLARHSRQLSTISTSSSDYSCHSESRDTNSTSDDSSQVTRRSSTPSMASADRRRRTTVELDPPSLTPPASVHQRSASESSSRKTANARDIGIVGTAQLTSGAKQQGTSANKIPHHIPTTNNTNSTTLHPPIFQQPKSATPSPSPSPEPTLPAPVRGLTIMKRDRSKEPAPPSAPPVPPPQSKPEIADERGDPVAPPNRVGLDRAPDASVGGIRLITQPKPPSPVSTTTLPTTTSTTSTALPPTLVLPKSSSTVSYGNYQPGVHSTAGPLPPPPRLPGFDSSSTAPLSPPPPRPPRLNSPLPPRSAARAKDLEAVKQALQLPPSVSAALATKPTPPSVLAPTEQQLKKEAELPAKSKAAHTDAHAAPLAAIPVARSTSGSGPTIPSSPTISDSSTSSYSMVQRQTPSVHRREGAFPPSSSDIGSDSIESVREKDRATEKRAGLAIDTAATSANTILDADDDPAPQVTVISEPPVLPSPILEEPASKGEIDDDSLRPRHRREHGQVVVMSEIEDDSNENWVAISRLSSPSPSTTTHNDRSTSLDHHRVGNGADKESGSRTSSEAPSPPPKSFRNSITTGLKRFSSRSLPRTPSVSSGGSRRSSSVISKRFSTGSTNLGVSGPSSANVSSANASYRGSRVDVNSRTPSPSGVSSPLSPTYPRHSPQPVKAATVDGHSALTSSGGNDTGFGNVGGASVSLHGHGTRVAMRPVVRQKIVVQWPSAMFCNEIHVNGRRKLSTSERCAVYARKINELNMYDCGLTGWVVDMRCRGPNSNSTNGGINKKYPDVRSPANAPFTPQPRQTSRSSVVSDATFPTRADATTATDLLSSSHENDAVYREDVPALPYPSLATQQRAAASNVVNVSATMTPPQSIRSLGSNSTLPSGGGNNNNTPTHNSHTLTHTHSLSYSHSHAPTVAHNTPTPATLTLSPISPTKHNSITSPTTTGFFASLGRKASLTSGKRPKLGSLISSPISSNNNTTSSSSSNGLSSPHSSSRRLLTKSGRGGEGGEANGSPLNGGGVKQPVNVGGITMNPATPPSVAPYGPRAPPGSFVNNSNGGGGGGMGHHNRVQRSKTYMPSTSSPFNSFGREGAGGGNSGSSAGGGGGHGYNAGIERRPSLWELQLNTTSNSGVVGGGGGGGYSSSPVGMASPISGSNTPTTMNSQSQGFYSHVYPNTLPIHNGTTSHSTPQQQQQQQQQPVHHSQPYTPTQYSQHHQHPQQHQQVQPQPVYDPHSDPEFIRQVDKLASLLPHADRFVLEGYLRRAGQDVLAIGQYLEDEKNGTLKAY